MALFPLAAFPVGPARTKALTSMTQAAGVFLRGPVILPLDTLGALDVVVVDVMLKMYATASQHDEARFWNSTTGSIAKYAKGDTAIVLAFDKPHVSRHKESRDKTQIEAFEAQFVDPLEAPETAVTRRIGECLVKSGLRKHLYREVVRRVLVACTPWECTAAPVRVFVDGTASTPEMWAAFADVAEGGGTPESGAPSLDEAVLEFTVCTRPNPAYVAGVSMPTERYVKQWRVRYAHYTLFNAISEADSTVVHHACALKSLALNADAAVPRTLLLTNDSDVLAVALACFLDGTRTRLRPARGELYMVIGGGKGPSIALDLGHFMEGVALRGFVGPAVLDLLFMLSLTKTDYVHTSVTPGRTLEHILAAYVPAISSETVHASAAKRVHADTARARVAADNALMWTPRPARLVRRVQPTGGPGGPPDLRLRLQRRAAFALVEGVTGGAAQTPPVMYGLLQALYQVATWADNVVGRRIKVLREFAFPDPDEVTSEHLAEPL